MNLTAVPQLINDHGYSLLMDAYEGVPTVRERLFEVVSIPSDGSVVGDKGDVLSTVGRPKFIRPGMASPRDDFGAARTWYLAVHKLSRSIEFTKEMIAASDAAGRLQRKLEEAGREFGESFQGEKEDWVAGMMMDGSLTAGSSSDGNRPGYFDGSFPGNADPYPTLIYDNQPWFDTAHADNIASTSYANHVVTAALTSATLQAAKVLMRVTNAYNYRKERITIRPDVLVVPATLEDTAKALLESELKPGSANNDINIHRGSLDLVVFDRLVDDTDAWWLGQRGKGVRILDSGAPVISSYFDEERQVEVLIYTSYFGAAVTDWRYWVCENKAAT